MLLLLAAQAHSHSKRQADVALGVLSPRVIQPQDDVLDGGVTWYAFV
jgi:hypothetical protein